MTSIEDAVLVEQVSAGAQDADARNAFLVDLDGYEGPLHLLLDLARRQKVDLRRISILELADQYLAFVRDAQDRRMDLAADYLLMAAWLAYLKSRLLLPAPVEAPEDGASGGEAMAQRLAFRLARLAAMREAAADLYRGQLDGRDVFARGDPERPRIVHTPVWTTSLYDLLKAFGEINGRKVRRRAHLVRRQPVLPLEAARRRLAALLPELDDWTTVETIRTRVGADPEAPVRSVVASVFSAALELTRDRAVELRQDAPFRDIYVRRSGAGAPPSETTP